MKKMFLALIAMVSLFANSASSANLMNWNALIEDSGCYNYSWTSGTPEANTCHDIKGIYAKYFQENGLLYYYPEEGRYIYEELSGPREETIRDYEGKYLYIIVDVFGVPADEPTVMYKYKDLSPYQYQYIVTSNGLVNGKRFWYRFEGDNDWGYIDSGDIIVKHGANIVDRVHIK